MSRFFSFIFLFIVWEYQVLALSTPEPLVIGNSNDKSIDGSILSNTIDGPIGILTLIQSVLLKVVLPVIVVGASLYIAYTLFTAEWDESKMKKAWKSLTYSAVGLIAVALSYAFVSIISRINL